ncbi:hypothetical protein [Kitasatospora sp. NPDC048538]|uniref:hypothetical protein n=1 Tax=unclassified Kitasatospora TaxID=2633591 RepID=UPI0033F5D458
MDPYPTESSQELSSMAQTFPGWQAPPVRPSAPAGRGRRWPWLVLGFVELAAAGPMLVAFAMTGLVAGVMGLAAGGTANAAVGLVLMLAAGPVAGLAAAAVAIALFAPAVSRFSRSVVFAVLMGGLLAGTAVEYVGWVAPALG